MVVAGEVAQELVVEAGGGEVGAKLLTGPLVVAEDPEHPRVLVAEQELHGPVLQRLEARRVAQLAAELRVLDRGQRRQHRPLLEQLPLDVLDAGQPLQRRGHVVGADQRDRRPQLVDQQLQPQLGDLVLDDEEHLVVVVGDRVLGVEQPVQAEVAAVRHLPGKVGGDALLDLPVAHHLSEGNETAGHAERVAAETFPPGVFRRRRR